MIDRSESNGIVTLTLNHGKAAALDVELLEALQRELAAAADAPAIVLTGSGSIFSAGRALPPDAALAAGLIDEVVAPDALLARAAEVAAQLAAIPRAAFRVTKAQLRAPAVEAMRLGDARDAEALAAWSDPAVHQYIREYLARTVRRS